LLTRLSDILILYVNAAIIFEIKQNVGQDRSTRALAHEL
jgi:hypothetical protein